MFTRPSLTSFAPTRRTLLLVLPLVAAAACRRSDSRGGPYAAMVAEAVPQIERSVGLKFKRPPVIEPRDRGQVRQYVLQQLQDTAQRRDILGTERAYKLFALIPDTLNLLRLDTDLLAEQIVGYYDPKTKVLYVVNGADRSTLQTVVTHELVHALQDQYVNLDSVENATGDDDRTLAAQSVFEGQAVFEQMQAMLGNENMAEAMPGGWERVRDEIRNNQAAMPVYSSAPLAIQETLLFPYLSGAEFIRNYKQYKHGGVPYGDLPKSTEQVMHPYAYFTHRDPPLGVTVTPPAGAQNVYQNDMGEFGTRLFLYQQLKVQDDAVRGAAGWGGDRYVVFATPHGDAMAWATVWDTQGDADEFDSLLQRAKEQWVRPNRNIQITAGAADGKPAVLWLDLPVGESAAVTLRNVHLSR